ncbi:MAG: DUF58 domain-containing protein [Ilumatobacter sp.]
MADRDTIDAAVAAVRADERDNPSGPAWFTRVPVTPLGVGVGVLGIAAYIGGWRLGWIELLVLAAGCFVSLLIAIPFILGRSRIDIVRRHEPDRVSAGDTVRITLTATNTGRSSSRRVIVDEIIGGRHEPVSIPSLAAGESTEAEYRLPTRRRAKLALGPAVITRSDALGLMRRDVSESDVSICWVYPRTRYVAPLPVGFAKDLEGPTSDSSPAGDVAFHTIRPYRSGDDRRHIHWLTTAKTGSLMVRHFVDNRRPHVAVLLDCGRAAYPTNEAFETAVSIAASLSSSMLAAHLPASVRLGPDTVLGNHVAADELAVLQHLTLIDANDDTPNDLAVNAAGFLRSEPHASALVVVTGSRSAEDLLALVVHARRNVRLIIVHVDPTLADGIDSARAARTAVPGARSIHVSTVDEFAAAWSVVR